MGNYIVMDILSTLKYTLLLKQCLQDDLIYFLLISKVMLFDCLQRIYPNIKCVLQEDL